MHRACALLADCDKGRSRQSSDEGTLGEIRYSGIVAARSFSGDTVGRRTSDRAYWIASLQRVSADKKGRNGASVGFGCGRKQSLGVLLRMFDDCSGE